FYSNPELIALPVTFVSFDAQKASAGTQLTWKVGTEVNVKLYEVERSINGEGFTRVGFVAATGAASYSFTDTKLAEGTVLYRIKNVDYDGRSKYSSTINFKNGLTSIAFKAFPLPAQNLLTVQHTTAGDKAQINIASTDGKTLRTIMLPVGATQTDVNLTGLKTGMYLLRFTSGKGNVETMKILKQ
ncbi:MAG TPA: T9SS type A sorting domain-containing protein, partial [Chitinophagaceae bacterium]|nr:T9SS type A sorting domain-containing protein [Chitinophagaceae bacterium]